MSKITFRADDDLIRQLEEFDASKSEVMREALREYLGEADTSGTASTASDADTVDDVLAERVDELIAERLDRSFTPRKPQDINVNISLDAESADASVEEETERKTTEPEPAGPSDEEPRPCKQCGETLEPSAVYCANCGEKASHRVFCECGDELRSDWAFCPSCGRRTPAADVLGDT
ncbi:double zinc ribbon domain-containing protein [Halorarius halobius]|uniref:double zinc ribbon domain-containing protein n=1 Tax=Halorarius halobius TaxID=2962671 RepID=UPI0020CCD191|nr:zinc ribbon domain-containing protein [Halorarius halobius]